MAIKVSKDSMGERPRGGSSGKRKSSKSKKRSSSKSSSRSSSTRSSSRKGSSRKGRNREEEETDSRGRKKKKKKQDNTPKIIAGVIIGVLAMIGIIAGAVASSKKSNQRKVLAKRQLNYNTGNRSYSGGPKGAPPTGGAYDWDLKGEMDKDPQNRARLQALQERVRKHEGR